MNTTLHHDLWSLIKPRIVALLCITGVFSLLAAGGWTPATVLAFTVAGGCIAASGAAFNCWYDRTLDRHMGRTADRPLPSGRLDHRIAAVFATGLLLAGTVIGMLTLPLESVVYMLLGFAAYVGLYTVLLKRRHWLGVVLGGSAGSFPVLAGWTSVQPLAPQAIIMAIVVFVWTPAHAWALGYVFRSDYANVDVPTLPVVASKARLKRWIWYSVWGTVAVAASAIPFASPPYTVTVVGGGALFVLGFYQFHRTGTKPAAVRAFFTSNLFLGVLFVAWGFGEIVTGTGVLVQVFALIALPILFIGLWNAQPSLRGVPASVGGEWKVITRRLRNRSAQMFAVFH